MPESTPRTLPLSEFVVLVASLVSIGAFAIDAMLPAIPVIAADLGAAAHDGHFIITALFAGYCLGQAFFGPLSDSIGRKPAIYAGAALFVAGCGLSIVSDSFAIMLAGRALQGAGAAAMRVVSTALVRDTYSGVRMARIIALVMAVFIIIPVLAPSVGLLLMRHADWRAIFVALVVQVGVAITWFASRQPETLATAHRRPVEVNTLLAGAREVFAQPVTVGYTLISGLMFGGMVGYLSTAQPIFQDIYRVGDAFPIYFGSLASAIGLASILNSKLVGRVGTLQVSRFALWMMTTAALGFNGLVVVSSGPPPLWSLLLFLFAAFAAIGLTFGNFSAMAMEPLGHLAGIGAAVVNAGSTLVSLTVGALIGEYYDGSVVPLALGFALVGPAGLLIMTLTERARPDLASEAA